MLLVLNLWATWCPPCRREMPSLERLSKSVDTKRIAVAGMMVDTDAPDGKIVHRILGERDWSSPAMLRVLEEAYQGKRSELE